MSSETNPSPIPAADRRNLWRLAWVGVLIGVAGLLLWWFDPRGLALPPCPFHQATGLHCPFCGATRATHDLLHGDWLSALRHNALWVLSLPLLGYAAASELRRLIRGRGLPGDLFARPWFPTAVLIAAAVFGVLRNLPVHPFLLLAPPP